MFYSDVITRGGSEGNVAVVLKIAQVSLLPVRGRRFNSPVTANIREGRFEGKTLFQTQSLNWRWRDCFRAFGRAEDGGF